MFKKIPKFHVFGHQSTAKERAKHAGDYFTLLRHLLNYAYNSNINLPNAEVLLNNEIDWLKRIRVKQRCKLHRPSVLKETTHLNMRK